MQTTLTPTLSAYAAGHAITPLWVAPNGRAFYPIAGGADDLGGGDGADDGKPSGGDDGAKKFEAITSQEDLDRIIGTRLSREREKYADYEQLKAAKSEYDKLLEEGKTEQQKAIDAARSEGQTAERERSDKVLVRSTARALAAEAGALNSATAVAVLDLAGVAVADDGAIDEAAIKAKLDALKASQPFLFGKTGPRPDPSQGGGGGGDKPSVSRGSDLYDRVRGKKTS